MTAFTFAIAADQREVVVGTVEELATRRLEPAQETFERAEDLCFALQSFREQEWIITCVSEWNEFKTIWANKWTRPPERAFEIVTTGKDGN